MCNYSLLFTIFALYLITALTDRKLKHKGLLKLLPFFGLAFLTLRASAQVDYSPIFTTLRLEARADFDYLATRSSAPDTSMNHYGFNGRYFNLLIGGNLGSKFSYFFRQRIVATSGTARLFDNTDFLYLNFNPNEQWTIRLGKDAIAVGGFEYDAPPIDVLFSTTYWDNFYCFQLGASGVYKTKDGRNMIVAQVANSPYVYYGSGVGTGLGKEWKSGLMSYNILWSGTFGHFKTLYSVNMFERRKGSFMGYIALGHKLTYDRWDIYLDLLHHSVALDDWGRNFGVVSCVNFLVTKDVNLFAKAAYEQNRSEADILSYQTSGNSLDCLVAAGHSYLLYGLGFEWRPSFYKDVRLHGFVACRHDNEIARTSATGQAESTRILNANIGITWNMNIHKILKERVFKKEVVTEVSGQ